MNIKRTKVKQRGFVMSEHGTAELYSDQDVMSECVLFDSVEELWFWFIGAQQAYAAQARSVVPHVKQRPCEPGDILNILNRLYQNRLLKRDHLLVLRHYGRRGLAPDIHRIKEVRASKLWDEAMDRLRPVCFRRGFLMEPHAVVTVPSKVTTLGEGARV